MVASCLAGAYRDEGLIGPGLIRLGSSRSLAVVAVDGLGYRTAAAELAPDVLVPLTTTFPSTTTTAFVSSLTGSSPSEHGVIGVQYLHPDGRRGYNCITGEITEPDTASTAGARAAGTGAAGASTADGGARAGAAGGSARAGPGPVPRTVFNVLGDRGVPSFTLPGELAGLPPAWRATVFSGSRVLDGQERAGAGPGGVAAIVGAVTRDLEAAAGQHPGSVVWAYLNLDDHLHAHGPDPAIGGACRAVDALARRLTRQGVAVLLYADHGCTASRSGPATVAAWQEVASPAVCRLPAGGAGRARWLYPRPGQEARLAGRLRELLPGAVVTAPEELAGWGLVEAGSPGQARLGEVVLLARGPDFPVPDPRVAYEHGSLTADEMLVPLAVWQPDC